MKYPTNQILKTERYSQATRSIMILSIFTLMILLLSETSNASTPWSTVAATNNTITSTSSGAEPKIVSCPSDYNNGYSGGVITVFVNGDDVQAIRCDAANVETWGPVSVKIGLVNGLRAQYISVAPDGFGGVYVAIMYASGTIYGQHITDLGATAWGTNGLLVSQGGIAPVDLGISPHPSIAAGFYGSATVCWTGRLATTGLNLILAQNIQDPGILTWGGGTVPISIAPGPSGTTQGNCEIVGSTDPYSSSYFVTFEDTRNGNPDIYCQALEFDGTTGTDPNSFAGADPNGFPICTASGEQHNPQIRFYPQLGGGPGAIRSGLYIAWFDARNVVNGFMDLYVHCGDGGPDVSGDFSGDGILVASQCGSPFVMELSGIISTSYSNDLIIAWVDNSRNSKIFGQRIDKTGQFMWAENGMLFADAPCANLSLVTQDGQSMITYSTSNTFRGQRISSNGGRVWGFTGKPLSTPPVGALFFPPQSAVINNLNDCDRQVASVWWLANGSNNPLTVMTEAMHWTDGLLGGAPFSSAPDVWLKDTDPDYGDEPGTWDGTPFWESPDIWNTLSDPQLYPNESLVHQDPVINLQNWLRVKLRNRGCYSGNGTLTVYYATAMLGATWVDGSGTPPDDWTELSTLNVPALSPGEERIFDVPWTPLLNTTITNDDGHHCFIARYSSAAETLDQFDNNPPGKNGIAQKNMHLIDEDEFYSRFFVRNLDSGARTLDMDFDLHLLKPITSKLNGLGIRIKLDKEIFAAWTKTGQKGTGIKVNLDSSIQITDTSHASIMGVPLAAHAFGKVNCQLDSLNKAKDEHFFVRITQHTHGGNIKGRRLDGGLTWDIHTAKTIITPLTGGDTIADEKPTNRPTHIQTYAIYVVNRNQQKATIDRVIVGVDSKSTILAIGPPQDSQKNTISLAKDKTGRRFVYQCAPDYKVRLYAGEPFRPIYLTVAGIAGSPTILHFSTLDVNNKVLTSDSVILKDPLSIVHKEDPAGIVKQGHLLDPFPNPAATMTSFQVHLDQSEVITLTVADALGKEVGRVAANERFDNGDHVFIFSTSELSSGTYYVMLNSSFGRETKVFKVVR